MNRSPLLAPVAFAGLLASTGQSAMGQTTILNDMFTGGNTTGYTIAATKNAPAPSFASGHYTYGLPSTSSAFVETQARFTGTPVSLASSGDYINLRITFVDTSGVLAASGANGSLNVGLYNTGGVDPLSTLAASGLSAATTYNRGGAQLWQGYMGRVLQSGTAGIYTRSQQNAVTDGTGNDNNGNQDLLFTGAGTGTYKNPTGTPLGTQTAAVSLTAGSQYTLNYRITLSAPDQLTLAYDLYSGADTTGTSLFSQSATASGANLLTTSFDGLALGWRYAGTTGDPASSLDLNQVLVTASVSAVPEPSSFTLFGLGLLGLPMMRRFCRR
ncbi:MAG TPA: PEP-CTERM sorting domain-containing protein [Candidatus Paceibacterota bacterium]|nr:PEP-CTERM sorting domain-containing protein [Candidatus Paceibacterota bacterium]